MVSSVSIAPLTNAGVEPWNHHPLVKKQIPAGATCTFVGGLAQAINDTFDITTN